MSTEKCVKLLNRYIVSLKLIKHYVLIIKIFLQNTRIINIYVVNLNEILDGWLFPQSGQQPAEPDTMRQNIKSQKVKKTMSMNMYRNPNESDEC